MFSAPSPRPWLKPLLFAVGVLTLAVAGWFAALLYIDWRARQLAELTEAALHATTEVLPDAEKSSSGRYETMRVPGRDEQACLRETGGQVNDTYMRCRQGYSYRRAVP